MGLIGGIAGFFGLSGMAASQKALIKEEINLMDAINAHVKWKARLEDYLAGGSQEQLDPMAICRDDQCALGKWIHGPALKHFHGNETFHQLRADHAQFHYVAANVITHAQANDTAAANAIFNGEYLQTSRKVIQALTDLNRAVNE